MMVQHDAPGYVAPWNLKASTSSVASDGTLRIGVLALQGAFREHILHFQAQGVHAIEVKNASDLDDIDGLTIPGGESTSMVLIAERQGILDSLRQWVKDGRPTWGTCAGMIMLANEVDGQKDGGQGTLGGMDILVSRNHFGRQAQSFEANVSCSALQHMVGGTPECQAIFIRAPCIQKAKLGVEVIGQLPANNNPKGEEAIVAARQGPFLACAFHPELTQDGRWHEYFAGMVKVHCCK